jgi:hypothetical protein
LPWLGEGDGKTSRPGSDHRPMECDAQIPVRFSWIGPQEKHDADVHPDGQTVL